MFLFLTTLAMAVTFLAGSVAFLIMYLVKVMQ
jgi:hypothetical protein